MANKTNEQMLRELLKNIDSLEACILRERIVAMMEQTKKSIEENPRVWKNQIVGPNVYLRLAEKVDAIIGFEN